MPGIRSLSPLPSRPRNYSRKSSSTSIHPSEPWSPPPSTQPHHTVHFPKLFEEAWGNEHDIGTFHSSPVDRARVFLSRIASLERDRGTANELRAIVAKTSHNTVSHLASAVQSRIFADRHASFTPTPLLQAIRFMLIKANVPQSVLSDRTRAVLDFFFDPTLERDPSSPPKEVVAYPYPAGRLKVAIIGGGPTALASAISLAEKGNGKVEVHLWERRWMRIQRADGTSYVDYPATARRRDQVVTLQDSVTTLLSPQSFEALFAGRPERVWPGSANIQIRKVEDRFLALVQTGCFRDLIHLHTEGVSREDLSKTGDFHVLLGADGAASWIRQSYFHGYESERGRSWALGLAFNRPAGLPWSQPLNVFLTLGQTRYLLNASDYDGRGYLNMQLTDSEWDMMTSIDGQPVHFGRPGCLRKPDGTLPDGFEEGQLFAPSENRGSALWTAISDGLKLFGFKESEVINIVRIPIVVQAVQEGVQQLPPRETHHLRRPHALVAVAGDAAMTVHFWPGRGLNSGIKSGIALGDELVHALNHGRFIGMPLEAMKEYNDFIVKLQGREHDKRSIPILDQSGTPETLGWLLEKADTVPDEVAIAWLIGAMTQIADRLEGRRDWAYDPVSNVEAQLRIILRQLDSKTLKEMAVSFPWPTREMAGAEVLPIRSMIPIGKQSRLKSIWSLLSPKKGKAEESGRRRSVGGNDRSTSNSRFEAPQHKARSPSPLPTSVAGLRRSNATGSTRQRSDSLEVPGLREQPDSLDVHPARDMGRRGRSPSPAFGDGGNMTLGRMMTISRKPPSDALGEALSLALFRVQEAT